MIFEKIRQQQKHSEMKEHVRNWSDAILKVIGIDKSGLNGQGYKLNGLSKGYFRNELLLVEWTNYLILQEWYNICCTMYTMDNCYHMMTSNMNNIENIIIIHISNQYI